MHVYMHVYIHDVQCTSCISRIVLYMYNKDFSKPSESL